MKKRISFHTFGCRLNQSETAAVQNSFAQHGYEIVGSDKPTDIVVINTCTVTDGGDADTRHLVHKVNRQNPHAQIALIGCQAQVQKERLAGLPNVRWIVGNGLKMDLVNVFKQYPDPPTAQVLTPTIDRMAFTMPVAAIEHDHTRANIKVQDGCDFFCSFCEIPYARGRARSRVFEDIAVEARQLVEHGHRELVLTGINIGTYSNNSKSLQDIIVLLTAMEGVERIRISSIEPTTLSREIFQFMAPGRKLCRYLHLPLQSGDNEILRLMKRKYTVEEFAAFATDARRTVEGICLGTDIIVGFPGETEVHFERSVECIRKLPIDYVHVFSYSPRYQAQSRFKASLPAALIAQRSSMLRELSAAKRRLFHESLLGSIQTVLFERPKEGGWQSGLTDNYVRVKVKESQNLFNQLLAVRLEYIDGQSMIGSLM